MQNSKQPVFKAEKLGLEKKLKNIVVNKDSK